MKETIIKQGVWNGPPVHRFRMKCDRCGCVAIREDYDPDWAFYYNCPTCGDTVKYVRIQEPKPVVKWLTGLFKKQAKPSLPIPHEGDAK